jgi:hypothetical protein
MGATFGALTNSLIGVGTRARVGDGVKLLGGSNGKSTCIDTCEKGDGFSE